MYQGMLAETIFHAGHAGDSIQAYLARPLGPGPYPSVIVIHHMPGWDEASKEIARKFAYNGYIAIAPNLHYREAPGAKPDDAAAAVRSQGGVPDERCIGDVDGSATYLRSLPYSNGKVGVIGYCSGGRQVYIVACNIPSLDAAVDCYGGRVVMEDKDLTERMPVSPLEMTPNMNCPILGLFGAEDANPDKSQVNKIEQELKLNNKPYEFHTYEGAGHGFFSVDRPSYNVEAANDGWEKIFDFYGRYLN